MARTETERRLGDIITVMQAQNRILEALNENIVAATQALQALAKVEVNDDRTVCPNCQAVSTRGSGPAHRLDCPSFIGDFFSRK